MNSTMQDSYQLTLQGLFEHGARIFASSEVVTFTGTESTRRSYAQVAERIRRLASGLQDLGISAGDRIGTFCWNTQEHLEAYFAVPCMGAVLHTVNVRLFPDQVAYTVNHAEDRVLLIDASLISVLLPILPQLRTVQHYILIGTADSEFPFKHFQYETFLQSGSPAYAMPQLDERSAAAMCYTSGTTGNPKGVIYSHRSIYLHSLALASASTFGLCQNDRVLAPNGFSGSDA